MRSKKAGTQRRLAAARCLAFTLLFFLGTSGRALAVDGVVEINQAKASAGGVTVGDAAGLPVTISEPGSYRLTGNLTIPDISTEGIVITVEGVTLDLNGFAISGPVTCSGSGSSVVCSPSGFRHGIDANGISRVVVRNGTVRGFAGIGVFVGTHGWLEHLLVTSNKQYGIFAGDHSVINDVTATVNGAEGLYLGNLVKVTDSVVTQNLLRGLLCGDGCMIRETTSKQNGLDGLYIGNYGTASSNIAENNEGNGIRVGNSGVVSFNSSNLNGASGGSQIVAGQGCLVTGNAVRNATGSAWGLSLHAATGYSNNVIFGPGNKEVLNGINLGHNQCTTIPCP